MNYQVTRRQFTSFLPAALVSVSGCSGIPKQVSQRLDESLKSGTGEGKWLTELEGYLPIFIEQLDGDRYLTGGKYYGLEEDYVNVFHRVLDAEGKLISETIREDIQGGWHSGTSISSGGFALAGTMRRGNGKGNTDGRVARYDENGEELWNKIVREQAEEGDNTAERIVEMEDGHLIFIGVRFGEALEMTKLSPDGSVIWNTKVYEGPNDPPANPERLMVHNGKIIAGLSGSFENKSAIVALDQGGDEVWRKETTSGGMNIAMKGDDILSARSDNEADKTVVYRMNKGGDMKWENTLSKYYGGPISRYGDAGHSVIAGAGKRIWIGMFGDDGEMTADAIYGSATAENKHIADTVFQQNGDHIACGNMQEGDSITGWWGWFAKPEPQTPSDS